MTTTRPRRARGRGEPTVRRPQPQPARFPRTTFTGSVEDGVEAAKTIAGDGFVTIASADIIRQAIDLGLVDEICVSQVPVLVGTGIRYFGEVVGGHVMLEDPVVVQGTRALHLRYAGDADRAPAAEPAVLQSQPR